MPKQSWAREVKDVPEFAGGGLGLHRGAMFTLLHDTAGAAGGEDRGGVRGDGGGI